MPRSRPPEDDVTLDEEFERATSSKGVNFVSSGCFLLDLALGGGWAQGRMVNVVGDRSAGKTLLVIEAAANFARIGIPPADIGYREAEAAFDEEYAQTLGFPKGVKPVTDIDTVEALHDDFKKFLEARQSTSACFYALDSFDALSDEAEMKRDIDESSFGAAKAKKSSEMFRKLTRLQGGANCTLFIISQIRDNIGVTFGEKHKRSGGKALDFYASQIIWLHEAGKIDKTVGGIKRIVGVNVKAKIKKNKVGLPFREVQFRVIFGYGIDDEFSMLDWLVEYEKGGKGSKFVLRDLSELQWSNAINKARREQDWDKIEDYNAILREEVRERWEAIEEAIAPPMRKYR